MKANHDISSLIAKEKELGKLMKRVEGSLFYVADEDRKRVIAILERNGYRYPFIFKEGFYHAD